jgi:hypothetical protein
MSFLSSPSRTRGHLPQPLHREFSLSHPRPPWPPSRPLSSRLFPSSPMGDDNSWGGENSLRRDLPEHPYPAC